MCRSQPTSSPVSSKMHAAPCGIRRSNARPIAGFAVMPLVPSEPPQTVPTTSSVTAIGTGSCVARSPSASSTQAAPRAMVLRVPPLSWITSVATGRPEAAIASSRLRRLKLSHPSETSSTAPTFGCMQSRFIIRSAYAFG